MPNSENTVFIQEKELAPKTQSFSAIIDMYVSKFGDNFTTHLKRDLLRYPVSSFVKNVSKKYKNIDIKNINEILKNISKEHYNLYEYLISSPTLYNIMNVLGAYKTLSYEKFTDIKGNTDFPFGYNNMGENILFNINTHDITFKYNNDIVKLHNLISSPISSNIIMLDADANISRILLNTYLNKYKYSFLIPKSEKDIRKIYNFFSQPDKNRSIENILMKLIEYDKIYILPTDYLLELAANDISQSISDGGLLFEGSPVALVLEYLLEFSKKYGRVILYGNRTFISAVNEIQSKVDLPITTLYPDNIKRQYKKWLNKVVIDSQKDRGIINEEEYKNYLDIIDNDDIGMNIDNIIKSPHNILSIENAALIEENISKVVLGQERAIGKALESISVGSVADKKKPLSILFVGPSGVGKTLFGKELARYFDVPFLQMDMSLYALEHSLTNILGSPKSYVGYKEITPLEDFLSKINITSFPSGILVLDEAEKSHPKVITSFLLPLLDGEGVTFSSTGKKYPYGLVVIATTNGEATKMYDILHRAKIGFNNEKEKVSDREIGSKALENYFPPELLGRFYSIIEFQKLDSSILREIAKRGFINMTKRKPTKKVAKQIEDEIKYVKDGRDAYRTGELIGFKYLKEHRVKK